MITMYIPVVPLPTIKPDPEFTIDRRDSAATATHPLRQFTKSHIGIAQKRDDAVEFMFGEVLAFRSDHVRLLRARK
jgi:hypothetical protein